MENKLINKDLSNQESEEQLIGIILVKPERLKPIKSLIDSQDFFDSALRTIYNCMVYLETNNKPIDIVSVSEQLKFDNLLENVGGRQRLNELADGVISTVQYKQLCKIINKYSKKRRLLSISDEIETSLADNVDVDDVSKKASRELTSLLYNKTSTNLNTLISGVDDVLNEIDVVLSSDNRIFGLPTGFYELDKMISGLCKSKLYILAARPRVGKSAMAQQIAENVSQTHRVLFHSLEMKSSQYTKRSIFRRAGINTELMTRGMISKDDALNKASQASEELSQLNLYIDDSTECTLASIEKNILLMNETMGGCDLVVIDYAQLMQSDNPKVWDRFDVASYNSTGLKKLANKYDIPILLLAQLSRKVDDRADKIPMLSDLKDTGNYEQDADVIMFIYRGEVYGDTTARGKADLIIAKNREGRTGTIPFVFKDSNTEFIEYKRMI